MLTIAQIETHEHIVMMQSLAQQHHEELGKAFNEPFSIESVKRACEHVISDKERVNSNCWLMFNDGRHIGYIVGSRSINFYNWFTHARMEMLFVRKSDRNARSTRLLIQTLEEWARSYQCQRLYLSVGHLERTIYTENIGRYFNMIGFRQEGTCHVKELTNA